MKKLTITLLMPFLLLATQLLGQEVDQALKPLERGRFEKAKTQINKTIQANPTAETYFYGGYLAIRTGNLDAAQSFFEKGLNLDEKRHPFNKAGLGIVAHLKGRTAEAEAIFKEVLKKSRSKDAIILWRIGEAYTGYLPTTGRLSQPLYAHKDPQKAIYYLQKALKRNKKNGAIWLTMGDARALLSPGNGGPAVNAYEYAVEYMANKSLAKHRIGNVYWRARNYPLAGDYYKTAIEADSSYAPAYRQLAEVSFELDRFEEAATRLHQYVQLTEKPTTDLLFRSAKYDYLARMYERAINKIETLSDQIESPVKYRLLGRSYFHLNDYHQAIANLTTWLGKAPEEIDGTEYELLGRSYLKTTDTTLANDSLAIAFLAKAAETDTVKNLYSEIAEMSYKQKNYPAVIRYVEAGEKKFPKTSVKDKFWLAMAAYKLGSTDSTLYAKADSAFAIVQETNPEHVYTVLYRAKSNFYSNRNRDTAYVKSIPFYERFVELVSDKKLEKKFRYDLKIALKYLYHFYNTIEEKPEQALRFAQQGRELYPNDKDFKQILTERQTVAVVPHS